ncbi:MAG: type II toxin-antitoxin system RelE/ParE family toxin [Silicimonas sp.]|nr:type II toxin-antitoxin system RelE/ParE family toxin [Silicimonas sp.]
MASYSLAFRAIADLDDIADYSVARWGRVQADQYLSRLMDRMVWLAASPSLGRARDDIAPGYKCFPEGQHLIFYIEVGDQITIIGVPRKAMDLASHLR